MLISCSHCNMDSAGNHEVDCPMNLKKNNTIEDFVKQVADIHKSPKIQLISSDEALIEKYKDLLSAYVMTFDMMEVAAEVFDVQKLNIVADFIGNALQKCVNEIIAIQELRKNEQ